MKKCIINIIKNNVILITTILLSIFIELFAISYTGCFPFLTKPLYPILILTFFIIVLILINKKIIQLILSTILLITHTILNTLFIFLFDSNGTVFEWAMYNQRNDAYGTLETFEIQYTFLIICLLVTILFFIFLFFYLKKKKQLNNKYTLDKKKIIILTTTEIIILLTIIMIPFITTNRDNKKGYESKLYSTTASNYQTMGIVANSLYQVIKGEYHVDASNTSSLEDFIYESKIDTSQYNGISKDNNLIIILVESLEWYPFTLYKEESKILYPNLTKLLNEGLVGSNFYQKEKTDVSEALSIVGSYPTGQYMNYDFEDMVYPFTLPNLLKEQNKDMVINSFHANYGDFYNRYNLHQDWGFEKLYAINEMSEYGVLDTWNHKKGERNLDSITFDKTKELMFPNNKQFFSFILSFSMHGFYGERQNLENYYEQIDALKIFNENRTKNESYLRTYMATLMDFDKAIGTMMQYLSDSNTLDNSTIILYSDHNTYYNNLTNYAKNIKEKYNPELYHIPFIIYDKKLTEEYKKDYNTNEITKFTTTADIVPTVLDIFGVDGWKNLYFGSSILVPNIESIVYSRNYGFFLTDQFIGYSLYSPIYKDKNMSKIDLNDFENRAISHLKKLENIDKIFYSNYFENHSYKVK